MSYAENAPAAEAVRAPLPELAGWAQFLVASLTLAAFGLLVSGVIPVTPWTWVTTGVLFVVFLVTADDQQAQRRAAARPLLAAIVFSLCIVVFYYLACRLLATHWQYGYTPFLLLLAALTVAFAAALHSPALGRRLLGGAGRQDWLSQGLLGPAAVLAIMLAFMTSVFAAVTLVAADESLISLTTGAQPSFEDVAQLFVWQFCKSIPLLDVNETLRWKPPFVYTGTGTGTLVLAYKLAVIVPIIGAFSARWGGRSGQSSSSRH